MADNPKLSSRHINFIALGGAIGTGLFLGSAGAISTTGPSVLLTYLLSGIAIFIMARSVGEMVVGRPDQGAFSSYAKRSLGPLAGFLVGWSYAILMLVIALAEISAIPIYMAYWLPDVPSWLWVLITIIGIGVLNAAPVRVYGESEFIMTAVLVATSVLLLIGGILLAIFGFGVHDPSSAIDNLLGHGGFFPQGLSGFSASFAVVVFAFGGTEAIGLTAAEADNPRTAIPSAINNVPFRIALFYIGLIGVTLLIFPWDTVSPDQSPFVTAMDSLGLNWAGSIFNVVILIAAISTINAVLYASGRMVAGLADDGLAPKRLAQRTKSGEPVVSVWSLVVVMIIAFIWHLISDFPLFLPAATLAACTALFCWATIVLSQIVGRMRSNNIPEFKAPLFPYAQYVALAFFLIVSAMVAFSQPKAFAISVAFELVLTASWFFFVKENDETAIYFKKPTLNY